LSQSHTPIGRLVNRGTVDYGRLARSLSGDTQAIPDASDLLEPQDGCLS
jgi:hypothetical protein